MTGTEINTLVQAAVEGDLATIKAFVDKLGVDAVRLDDDPEEMTLLHVAAAGGSLAVVLYLLAPPVSADPLSLRANNFTPLHAAAMKGHAAVCEALIQAGADPNIQTEPQRYSPLHSAAFSGHIDALRVLLRYGADRTLLNYRGEPPADTARRQSRMEAVYLLESDFGLVH